MPLSKMWLALLSCYLIVFFIESGLGFYAHQLVCHQPSTLDHWRRKQRRSRFLVWLMAATIFLHTVLLVERLLASAGTSGSTFSLRPNWFFASAFAFALTYFVYLIRWPGKRFGLFLYATILLLCVSLAVSPEPFARPPASRWLGIIHGVALVGATLAIFGGMLIGLMFQIQRRRLKRVRLSDDGDEYPSLEWLHRDLRQCFNAATGMMIVGLCSGVLLIRWSHAMSSEQIVVLPVATEVVGGTASGTITTTTTIAEGSTPAQDVVTIRIVSTEPLVWYDPLVLGCATLTLWLVVCQILIRRVPGWGNSTHLIRIINLSSLFYLSMLAILFWNVTRHGGAVHTVNTESFDRITTEREVKNEMDSHVTSERIREPQS